MISMGGKILAIVFSTRHVCVVIHAEIDGYGTARSGILNDLEVRDFD